MHMHTPADIHVQSGTKTRTKDMQELGKRIFFFETKIKRGEIKGHVHYNMTITYIYYEE